MNPYNGPIKIKDERPNSNLRVPAQADLSGMCCLITYTKKEIEGEGKRDSESERWSTL